MPLFWLILPKKQGQSFNSSLSICICFTSFIQSFEYFSLPFDYFIFVKYTILVIKTEKVKFLHALMVTSARKTFFVERYLWIFLSQHKLLEVKTSSIGRSI